MAPGTKEGDGTVQINFVSFETLLEYKGVGTNIAKQIIFVRKLLKNKLNKNDFHSYGIYKNGGTVIRHFDFTENQDEGCLEEEDFNYFENPKIVNDTEQRSVKQSDQLSTNSVTARAKHSDDQVGSRRRPKMKDLPPNLFFDGKGDFDAFERKFNSFVKMEEYDSKGRFFCLRMMLKGSASDYIDHLFDLGKVDNDIDAFLYLKDRFDSDISPHEAMVNFRNAKQYATESIDDFESRLTRLAKQAYPGRDNFDQIQTEVALSFMTGLQDSKARAYLAGNVREANMKEIRKVLGRHTFMRNILKEKNKDDSLSDDNTSGDEEHGSTRKVSRNDNHSQHVNKRSYEIKQISGAQGGLQNEKQPSRIDLLENKVTILEDKVDILCKDVRDLKDIVLEIQADLKELKKDRPPPRRNSIDKSQRTCNHCGVKGHFKSECPQLYDPNVNGSD